MLPQCAPGACAGLQALPACPLLTISCSATTVSSSAISASAANSVSFICSGPELVAGTRWAGAIGAARPRFTPTLSEKNH
eukprot:scaffold27883_cov62-Phaeocystis_antarctica.AAC.1